MTTLLEPSTTYRTVSDLLHSLGDVPPERVLLRPTPGTATEQDVLDLDDHHDRICELVDGTLVEKTIGTRESSLACLIIMALGNFVLPRKLGIVTGEAGMLRLRPSLVRIPDVAFITRVSPAAKCPRTPFTASLPIWPSRSSARATRSRRCPESEASISRPARDWCGNLTPTPRPLMCTLNRSRKSHFRPIKLSPATPSSPA